MGLCSRMFPSDYSPCGPHIPQPWPSHPQGRRPVLCLRATSVRATSVPEKKTRLGSGWESQWRFFFFLPTEKQLLIDLYSRPRTPSHPPPTKLLLIKSPWPAGVWPGPPSPLPLTQAWPSRSEGRRTEALRPRQGLSVKDRQAHPSLGKR